MLNSMESEQDKILRRMFNSKAEVLELFRLETMQLVLAYLNNYRTDLLEELISKELNPASFNLTQGKIQMIDDVLGIPRLLTSARLKQ